MGFSEYCSACLITSVKMNNSATSIELKQFLRFPFNSTCKEVPERFCFECAALLRKFEIFKRKCFKAQEVLLQLTQNNSTITLANILNVDRKQHKLESKITVNTLHCTTIKCTQDNECNEEENLITYEVNQNIDNLTSESNIHEVKHEIKDIQESSCHDDDHHINNYDFNESTTEITHNITDRKLNIVTDKKEHKSRKRKSIRKDIFESISDDEPLVKKASKIDEKLEENIGNKNILKSHNLKCFEDYATVVFLSPEDAQKELLLRKESNNYVNSPFKCNFCYRGFEVKPTFDNHMKKHSNENGEYECDICHLRFPEQRYLCKHRLACHKRKFSCKLCSYVCFCTYQAKTHMSLHEGKKYPCKECGEVFSMPNSLFMHKRLKHVTECVCDLCGNTFATPRGLYSHHMKIHRQDKKEKRGPKCEECLIHFATEKAWKLHLVLSSKHNVSNGCKYCGETFPDSEHLKNHMKVHARKQGGRRNSLKLPATCTICGVCLPSLLEYKGHMSAVHPSSDITRKLVADELAPFVCETCGLAFKKQCFLKYHQRKHTGERPYKCLECDKTFQVAGALSSHRAVHSQRKHACRVCDRVFTFKSALNKHMKVHLNIRPHRCDICEKSFINPCDVRLHIKYVHNKVPWPKQDRTKKTQDANY